MAMAAYKKCIEVEDEYISAAKVADKLFNSSLYAEAMKHYRIAKQSQNPIFRQNVHFKMFESCILSNQYAEAREIIDICGKETPKNSEVDGRKLLWFIHAGKLAEALDWVKQNMEMHYASKFWMNASDRLFALVQSLGAALHHLSNADYAGVLAVTQTMNHGLHFFLLRFESWIELAEYGKASFYADVIEVITKNEIQMVTMDVNLSVAMLKYFKFRGIAAINAYELVQLITASSHPLSKKRMLEVLGGHSKVLEAQRYTNFILYGQPFPKADGSMPAECRERTQGNIILHGLRMFIVLIKNGKRYKAEHMGRAFHYRNKLLEGNGGEWLSSVLTELGLGFDPSEINDEAYTERFSRAKRTLSELFATRAIMSLAENEINMMAPPGGFETQHRMDAHCFAAGSSSIPPEAAGGIDNTHRLVNEFKDIHGLLTELNLIFNRGFIVEDKATLSDQLWLQDMFALYAGNQKLTACVMQFTAMAEQHGLLPADLANCPGSAASSNVDAQVVVGTPTPPVIQKQVAKHDVISGNLGAIKKGYYGTAENATKSVKRAEGGEMRHFTYPKVPQRSFVPIKEAEQMDKYEVTASSQHLVMRPQEIDTADEKISTMTASSQMYAERQQEMGDMVERELEKFSELEISDAVELPTPLDLEDAQSEGATGESAADEDFPPPVSDSSPEEPPTPDYSIEEEEFSNPPSDDQEEGEAATSGDKTLAIEVSPKELPELNLPTEQPIEMAAAANIKNEGEMEEQAASFRHQTIHKERMELQKEPEIELEEDAAMDVQDQAGSSGNQSTAKKFRNYVHPRICPSITDPNLGSSAPDTMQVAREELVFRNLSVATEETFLKGLLDKQIAPATTPRSMGSCTFSSESLSDNRLKAKGSPPKTFESSVHKAEKEEEKTDIKVKVREVVKLMNRLLEDVKVVDRNHHGEITLKTTIFELSSRIKDAIKNLKILDKFYGHIAGIVTVPSNSENFQEGQAAAGASSNRQVSSLGFTGRFAPILQQLSGLWSDDELSVLNDMLNELGFSTMFDSEPSDAIFSMLIIRPFKEKLQEMVAKINKMSHALNKIHKILSAQDTLEEDEPAKSKSPSVIQKCRSTSGATTSNDSAKFDSFLETKAEVRDQRDNTDPAATADNLCAESSKTTFCPDTSEGKKTSIAGEKSFQEWLDFFTTEDSTLNVSTEEHQPSTSGKQSEVGGATKDASSDETATKKQVSEKLFKDIMKGLFTGKRVEGQDPPVPEEEEGKPSTSKGSKK